MLRKLQEDLETVQVSGNRRSQRQLQMNIDTFVTIFKATIATRPVITTHKYNYRDPKHRLNLALLRNEPQETQSSVVINTSQILDKKEMTLQVLSGKINGSTKSEKGEVALQRDGAVLLKRDGDNVKIFINVGVQSQANARNFVEVPGVTMSIEDFDNLAAAANRLLEISGRR